MGPIIGVAVGGVADGLPKDVACAAVVGEPIVGATVVGTSSRS